MQGDMSRPLIHHLHILLPGPTSKLTLRHEFGKLSFVIGIIDRSRTQPISNRKGNVVLSANVKNFVPMFVGEVFFVVKDVPFGMDGSTTRYNASLARDSHGNVTEEYTGVNGEVVYTLGGLFEECFFEYFPC